MPSVFILENEEDHDKMAAAINQLKRKKLHTCFQILSNISNIEKYLMPDTFKSQISQIFIIDTFCFYIYVYYISIDFSIIHLYL